MDSKALTYALVIMIVLAMLWATGRAQKLLDAVFGGMK